jgi:hypothetical protein
VVQGFNCGYWLAVGAGALIIGAVATPTFAQLKPEARVGSRLPVAPQEIERSDTGRILDEFATCIVEKRRALASAYIVDRSAFRFAQKYRRLADGECLLPTNGLAEEIALKLDDESMRYALAEALLRDELATIDAAKLSSAPPMPIPPVYDYSGETKARGKKSDDKTPEEERAADLAKIIMYKFGDCTVRANPIAAQAMLQAARGSNAEGIAVQSLMPALGSCLEKGAQVTLNRTRLRGALAVSYYSLAHAPPALAR